MDAAVLCLYGGMVEVIIRGYSLLCGDIWCSILVYHYFFAVCALLVSLVIFVFLIMRLGQIIALSVCWLSI